ncbi:MAG TPA: hypothetical protein VGP26_19000 [Actinophytocola sp.]|nr:hypothetical protein [Actinophytocola sp.]
MTSDGRGGDRTDRVEAALREVGSRLAVPEPPDDLATIVLARLDEPARRPAGRVLPRLVAAALALLAALAVAMAVSPTVRAAVLDFLRFGGVDIHFAPPPVAPTNTGTALPGERDVSLARARSAVDFDIRVPRLLGEPASVRVIENVPDDGTPPRVVSLRYDNARVDEFDGRISPVFEKFTHADDVVRTTVRGAPALWVPRAHPILYVDAHGVVHEEAARLAARTLIWEENGLSYRIEGDLTRQQAVAIAESMS